MEEEGAGVVRLDTDSADPALYFLFVLIGSLTAWTVWTVWTAWTVCSNNAS